MTFVIPPKSEVGVFDPAAIGEDGSLNAVLVNGEDEQWNPPALQAAFPDWSKVPQLRKYFGRKGGPAYPAWIFHPTEADREVRDADEAAEFGIFFRKTTPDEKYQFGKDAIWDWNKGEDDLKWRPFPLQRRKIDPLRMETGKIYQSSAAPPSPSIDSLVAAVTASVLAAMKTSPAPAQVDAKEWAEFQAFQAFKKTTETVNALEVEQDRASLEAQAAELGIKVDGRWSDSRLQTEIAKAA